jgi:hypothetical protein
MHPQEAHPLFQPPDLPSRHFREFFNGSAEQLLPGSFTPEEFPCCDATRFVEKGTDDLGVEKEG